MSVSPNGKIFAVESWDNPDIIDIWNIEKRKIIRKIECCDILTFEIDRYSSKLIICERDNLTIKSIDSGEVEHQIKSIDDKMETNESKILESDKQCHHLSSSFDWIDDYSVVISSNLQLILSHSENQIYVWDIKTGDLLRKLTSQHSYEYEKSLFVANESNTLVVYESFSSVSPEVWDINSGKLTQHCNFELYPNLGTTLTYDGNILFNAGHFFDIESGKLLNDFREEGDLHLAYLDDIFDYPYVPSFSRDGKTLVLGAKSGAIKVFNQFSIDEILSSESDNQDLKSLLIDKIISFADEQYEMTNLQEAINYYTTAIEIDPNNFHAYNRRSTARAAIGDYQGAMEDLNKVRMMN